MITGLRNLDFRRIQSNHMIYKKSRDKYIPNEHNFRIFQIEAVQYSLAVTIR